MSSYVEFATVSGDRVLVEVDTDEVVTTAGVEKAGLRRDPAAGAVAKAESTFEEAVASTVIRSVETLSRAVSELSPAPAEVELAFGLKATGEIGNIAVAKAGGEVNFTVRLLWRSGPT
ncbi:MAG: hypothetical protein LC777_15185 [Actinobacteria bacterium]|nr:hypothetical protein [Actinomycetota bacterium]